jgi:uncharacterized membrane protein
VRLDRLVDEAARDGAVIRLLHRPGHFVIEGEPLAEVWPATGTPGVARTLGGAHATGPHRTLSQDLSFAVDQLVEIAIRALSPAVNDTFTAIACVDWLSDALSRVAVRWSPHVVHRDTAGHIRVIAVTIGFRRLVERAHEKIRQASVGMPAVMIRQLAGLIKITGYTVSSEQRAVLLVQAEMIMRSAEASVPEPSDLEDIRRRHAALLETARRAGELV